MSEEKRHYNSGHVWGRVTKLDIDRDGRYISLTVECPNEMFGNLRTYVRIWGSERIAQFRSFWKNNPSSIFHFTGFFSQYTSRDERYSNYTVFQWQPMEKADLRAAFILVGEVTNVTKTDEGGLLSLHIERPATEGREPVEEDFEVYTLNAQEVDGIHPGFIVKAKGVLRYREAEDYYGDSPEGKVRPYVMEPLKIVCSPEPY